MKALEVSGLSFAYGRDSVLKDVSFALDRGSALYLLGPNGCGKSTLLGCILGFHHPGSGTILVEGKPVHRFSARQFAGMVSYVPQIHEKSFPYKVAEVVLMGRTVSHSAFSSPGKEDKRLALEALERVGLQGFAERRYTELSGGELRLVLIARALCQDSQLMLLDEPTAHLDFKHEINVLAILTKLIRDTGLTVLMASHSLNHPFYFENEGIDTRVALIDEGRIFQIGTPANVCTRENFYNVYGIESRVKVHHEEGKDRHYVISWK